MPKWRSFFNAFARRMAGRPRERRLPRSRVNDTTASRCDDGRIIERPALADKQSVSLASYHRLAPGGLRKRPLGCTSTSPAASLRLEDALSVFVLRLRPPSRRLSPLDTENGKIVSSLAGSRRMALDQNNSPSVSWSPSPGRWNLDAGPFHSSPFHTYAPACGSPMCASTRQTNWRAISSESTGWL